MIGIKLGQIASAILCMMIVSQAAAQEKTIRWKCDIGGGGCIGKVTMNVRKAFWPTAVGNYALSSFPDHEYLFEDFTAPETKKLFDLTNNGGQIFSGINGQAEAGEFTNRYQQGAGRAIFVVMTKMIGAFPEGENEMPNEWQTRQLENEGNLFDVSAKKSGKNKFLFKVKNYTWDVEGEWDVAKQTPWPDETAMEGWTKWGTTPVESLGKMRRRKK
jgi:hypothetical protein